METERHVIVGAQHAFPLRQESLPMQTNRRRGAGSPFYNYLPWFRHSALRASMAG
jgi:hypothetical protein